MYHEAKPVINLAWTAPQCTRDVGADFVHIWRPGWGRSHRLMDRQLTPGILTACPGTKEFEEWEGQQRMRGQGFSGLQMG